MSAPTWRDVPELPAEAKKLLAQDCAEPMMTRDELLRRLRELHGPNDAEIVHVQADDLLLDYIEDDEVREAFERIDKWYA